MNLCVVCVNLFVICAKFKALQNALWLVFWGVLQFATLQNALRILWREICALWGKICVLSEYCKFGALGALREFWDFSVVFENLRSEICVFGALRGVLWDKGCAFGAFVLSDKSRVFGVLRSVLCDKSCAFGVLRSARTSRLTLSLSLSLV